MRHALILHVRDMLAKGSTRTDARVLRLIRITVSSRFRNDRANETSLTLGLESGRLRFHLKSCDATSYASTVQ